MYSHYNLGHDSLSWQEKKKHQQNQVPFWPCDSHPSEPGCQNEVVSAVTTNFDKTG